MAKRPKRPAAAQQQSAKDLHTTVHRLLSGRALTGTAAKAFAADVLANAAPAAVKTVTFTCANPGCLVAITSGSIHFVFSGVGGANFPVGTNPLFYGIQGPPSQAFAITCQGGSLDTPISGQLTASGKAGSVRTLTVS